MKAGHSKRFFPAAVLDLNLIFMCPFGKEEASCGLELLELSVFQVLMVLVIDSSEA